MRTLKLTHAFWTRRSWPVWIVAACFLAELPWILLMDRDGVFRSIYGFSTLRIWVASLLGSESPSRNIYGWLTDLDKIVPYAATILVFLLFRRTLRSFLRATPSDDPAQGVTARVRSVRFPSWVTAFGVLGAALITAHYFVSGSGHYTSYQDKGLVDAVRHMASSGVSVPWASLMAYRLTYLVLSPVCYFVLFSTIAGAVAAAFASSSSAPLGGSAGSPAARAARCVLLSGIPIALLLLLHDVSSLLLGLKRYAPSGVRRWILYCLYAMFAMGFLITIRRLAARRGNRSGGRPAPVGALGLLVRELSKALDALQTPFRSSFAWTASFVLLVVPPLHVYSLDIRSSDLNKAIGSTAAFFVADYHHLPAGAEALDVALRRVLDDAPPETVIALRVGSVRHPKLQALTIATIGLRTVGFSTEQIVELARVARECPDRNHRDVCLNAVALEMDPLIARYPMFSGDARSNFESKVRGLISVWWHSFESSPWTSQEALKDTDAVVRALAHEYFDVRAQLSGTSQRAPTRRETLGRPGQRA